MTRSTTATSTWPKYTIDELKADAQGSLVIGPFGSRMKADCYVPVGVPVIRGNNLSSTCALCGEYVYITEKMADSMRSCNAYADDLVFPHRGAIGEVGIVPRDGKRYMISTSLMKLTCNRDLVNPLFLFYFFRSPLGRHELLKNASTVGTPGIGQPLTSLRSIRVPLPSRAEQDCIAEILGSLDGKIDSNQRMNETLEGMTKAIFKSWFVDFDPVRAKAAGHQPAGMDALFPDHFEDSPLGKIPKGWTTGTLDEIAEVIMGTSPPGDTYNEDGIGTPLVNGPVDFGDRFPVKKKWTTAPTRFSQEWDLIFCVRGSTTGRRVVSDGIYCLGRGVCAIRSLDGCQAFVSQVVDVGLEQLLSKITGSVFPNLNGPDIKGFKILLPPDVIIRRYCAVVAPVLDHVNRNCKQSSNLAATRDALLPKLLSGEVRVGDLEREAVSHA